MWAITNSSDYKYISSLIFKWYESIHKAKQHYNFLFFNGALYEGTPGGNIYWNVAYTTFIILYVNTKICSNFEVTILHTGLIC